MKLFNLKNYIGGWFIGNFSPTIINTKDFEIAIKEYKAGDYEKSHIRELPLAKAKSFLNKISY